MSTPEEDEAWRTIVENYGDRPEFPEAPVSYAVPTPPPPPPKPERSEHPELDEREGDHFVPQPVPPVHLPRGPRGLAWAGVFGVPVLVLLAITFSIPVAGWVSFLMLCWFVGGFGYLVATMGSDDPPEGWDHGAVV